MRKAKCSVCGSEQPSGEMFVRDGRPVCAACARPDPGSAASEESGALPRMVDPTVCAVCHADHGEQELPIAGGRPVCQDCSARLYARTFPLWLKASMAVLLLLLGFALWHSRSYFRAERHMVRGERALARQDYKQAADEFIQVINILPGTQKAYLLAAKARFMGGDPDSGFKIFYACKRYDHTELYTQVNILLKRSVIAISKASKAVQLDQAGQSEEAARLMNEAASEYPQGENLGLMAQVFSARAAFYRKDYDAALKFSQAAWEKNPSDPNLTASLAAALACKYAVTGDQQFRAQSEQMLAKAGELSVKSPQDHAAYLEYSPRILYRLQSREIIDNEEYQRRFGATAPKQGTRPGAGR